MPFVWKASLKLLEVERYFDAFSNFAAVAQTSVLCDTGGCFPPSQYLPKQGLVFIPYTADFAS